MTTNRHSIHEKALREEQLHRLRLYLRDTVVPFSPYYREKFAQTGFRPEQLRTLDDLRRIPFSHKRDLLSDADAVKRFVITPDRDILSRRPSTLWGALRHGKAAMQERFEQEFRPILLTSTTGRSADPVPFLYTAYDIERLGRAGAWVMEVCAARREDRMLNLFPFAPHLAFWITHYAGTAFGVFVVGTGGGKTMGTDGNLRLIRKLRPDVLIGMPTFLYHLLCQAASEGVSLCNLRKIVLGGEKVPAGMRRRLRALARELGAEQIDILCTYGFTEAKMAWAQCPYPEGETPGGYHLRPEMGLMEIVDPESGEPLPPGSPGEIVFTPIDARGSVVLRYRTGDLIDGGLFHTPCPHCGRSVPRLVGEIARKSEIREMRLDKVKGKLVDFNALEHILDDYRGVGTWQLELRKRDDDPLEVDELVLHAERRDGVPDAEAERALQALFSARAEIRPNQILFHTRETMRKLQGVGSELKESRVVDHRPRSGAPPGAAPAPSPQRKGEVVP